MVSKLLRNFLRAPQKCLKSVVDAFSEEVVDYTITSKGSVGKLILETKKVKTMRYDRLCTTRQLERGKVLYSFSLCEQK